MTSAGRSADTLAVLNDTVGRAARLAPYYRQAYAGLDLNFEHVSDLRRLPLLTRQLMFENSFELMAAGSVPVSVGMTGGTTSSRDGVFRQLITLRDDAESRARRDAIEQTYAGLTTRPLLLHLMNLGHGYDTTAGLDGVFQMAIERPFQCEALLAVLRRSFDFPGFTPRVVGMVGALRLIKALTVICMERGISADEFAIAIVSTSSNHLTSRWRTLLQEFWGAEVDETYGVSEVPGLRARRCVICEHFHFVPAAHVEVLGVDDDEPVDIGVGRVIATSLLPNASLQPVIRYDTDDLIDIINQCSRGGFGFEFLGRRRDVALITGDDGRPTCLASPIALNEVFDAFPDIATAQYAFAVPLGVRSHAVGYQKWGARLNQDGRRFEIDIELKWDPREYGQRAAQLRAEITDALSKALPVLANVIDAGELSLDLRLHAAGSTDLKAFV